MSYTLSTAPEHIIKNVETLKQIWKDSCEAIEHDLKGDYSRNLLLILNDLREEIDNNKDYFSNNSYGKKFFEIQIANYCTFKKNPNDELDNIKRLWTVDVHEELNFIVEALSNNDTQHKNKNIHDRNNNVQGKFELEDISILIKRIEKRLISENSFELLIKILYDRLIEENINDKQIEFLVDTLILLFNHKGIFEIKDILESQFEKFEAILTSESEFIFKLDDDEDKENLYPMVLESPQKNGKNINEYIQEVKEYYENLSIKDRLNLLKQIYSEQPKTYKVIFNITGASFCQKFNIGDVEFYNPKEDGIYINKDSKRNQLYSKLFFSSNPNEFEFRKNYCVAVDIEGIDSKFIAVQAKQIAERTIAALSTRTRKRRELPIRLSNDWIVCDSQGDIQNVSFTRIYRTEDISTFAGIAKNDYRQKLGRWISVENKCHPTVEKWLSSVDWYRKAIESSESSQEILNSWFAVEKFSEDSQILSKQILKTSQKFLKNNILKEIIDIWLRGDGIKTVQLLLVVSELKFHLYNEVRQCIRYFMPSFSYERLDTREIEYINHLIEYMDDNLKEYLYTNKKNVDFLEIFIEKLPEIQRQLDAKNKIFPALNKLNKIFYNNNDCGEYLTKKIVEIKDDIYNIYRIRNMLVHYGSSKSKLLDYYAKHSREYCYSLLDAIAYKIYETSSDDEIMPLDFYFREMVLDANLALEAVNNNKMDKFRHWALS
jgi:hypothetical protein